MLGETVKVLYYHQHSTCFGQAFRPSSGVPTHPHHWYTAGKHDNTQGCTYSFIGSWWWAEGLPETCRAL